MGTLRRTPAPATFVCAIGLLAACGEDGPTFQDARPIDAAIDAAIDADDTDAANARPGPVTAFSATPTGANLDLSWQNPPDTDLDATLVVASSAGPVTFTPVDGTTYTVAQVVGANQAVVNVQLATALAALPTVPGLGIEFAAWAHDTAGQYSATPATTSGLNNTLGAQTGMIQVFQNGTVTVTQQPRSLHLSGTATYDDAGDAMTVQLTVENQTGRLLFNVKGLVDSASQGTVTNPSFPATGGLPMAYYGPAAMAVGGTAMRQLDLTGITGTVDPVVLTMHFVDAPSLLLSSAGEAAQSVDSAASGGTGRVQMATQTCGKTEARGGVLSRDARFLYTGTKRFPRVTRTDLTSMSLTTSATLATAAGFGSVSDVFFSVDKTRLFAVLQDGKHAKGGLGTGTRCNGGGTFTSTPHAMSSDPVTTGVIAHGVTSRPVILVELNPTTLEEVQRVDLGITGFFSVGEAIAGNRAAVLDSTGHVAFVDLMTFTVIDTDAATAGVQSVALAGAQSKELMATNADGTELTVAVPTATGFRLDTINTQTFAVTSVVIDALDRASKPTGLVRTRDGKTYFLYWNTSKGPTGAVLVTIDGTQQSSTEPQTTGRCNALVLSSDETKYYVTNDSDQVRVFDRATHTELDTDGNASNGITPMPIANRTMPHGISVLTPF